MKKLQEESKFTELMVLQEDMKLMPLGDVWNEFLEREGVKNNYIDEIKLYEQKILAER